MDDAVKNIIINIKNSSPHSNIIKLTEEIYEKTQGFVDGEVVELVDPSVSPFISEDPKPPYIPDSNNNNQNAHNNKKLVRIINTNINNNKYKCVSQNPESLSNNKVLIYKREDLKRLVPITRNDIRKVILSSGPSPYRNQNNMSKQQMETELIRKSYQEFTSGNYHNTNSDNINIRVSDGKPQKRVRDYKRERELKKERELNRALLDSAATKILNNTKNRQTAIDNNQTAEDVNKAAEKNIQKNIERNLRRQQQRALTKLRDLGKQQEREQKLLELTKQREARLRETQKQKEMQAQLKQREIREKELKARELLKEVEIPKLVPFFVPLIGASESNQRAQPRALTERQSTAAGVKGKDLSSKTFDEQSGVLVNRTYIRVFSFIDIYHEYFSIPRPNFDHFNGILLDFKLSLPLLSKVFGVFIAERKLKRSSFYEPFLYILKGTISDANKKKNNINLRNNRRSFSVHKSEKNIDITEETVENASDKGREFDSENDMSEETISIQPAGLSTGKTNKTSSWFTKKINLSNFSEYILNFLEDVSEELNVNINTSMYLNQIGISYTDSGACPNKIKAAITTRLSLLSLLINFFGETNEIKALNENISSFNRESTRDKNLVLKEIGQLTNKHMIPNNSENPNPEPVENDITTDEKLSSLRLQYNTLSQNKFFSRFTPILGSYKLHAFLYLSSTIIIEYKNAFYTLKNKKDIQVFHSKLETDKLIPKTTEIKNLIDGLDNLNEMALLC
ncbi:hypothetical protein CDIK_1580 [Cucumispora dikerogammari]|nr:hypothetical protein CDIK_1580 [Cucumispora dikerogammari]